jgi:outer membrane protein assembly factor BamB
MLRTRSIVGLLLVGVLPSLLLAEDWRFFRGSPGQVGVAATSVPDKLETLWTLKCDDAFEGAVAVADGTVYAGCMDENLYALDLATGRQKWKFKAGPIKAAPVVTRSQILIGDLDGKVSCVDKNGGKVWTFETGAEVGGVNFGPNGILVSSHDEHLYCLDDKGVERWKFKTDGPVYGAPAVEGTNTFLVGCDSQLHVIDINKGRELGSVDLGGQTGATAAVLGPLLYVGTMRNEVLAIDWQKKSSRWRFQPEKPQAFFSSAAVTDKLVVIGCRDNRVYALDRASGRQQWSFPTGGKVDSSPVVAGTKVVVGSYDGNLYVLDLNTGRQLQQVTLDGPVSASPVVVEGRVLIGTQKGTLYCLGKKK